MPKSDLIRIRHMLDAAREAVKYIQGADRSDLEDKRLLNLSIVRLIEIIGEAANKVSPETQQKYSNIVWQDIIGMRHRLIHGYDDVDLDIIWQVVSEDLPHLIIELENILNKPLD